MPGPEVMMWKTSTNRPAFFRGLHATRGCLPAHQASRKLPRNISSFGVSRIHSSLLCYLELGNDCHAIVVRLSWQHLESRGPFSLFSFISVYLSNFPGEQPSCASFIRHTDTERITWRRLAQQWHPHRLCLGIRHPENLLPFCDDPQPTTVDQAVALLNVGFQRPQVLMRSLPSRFMKQKPPGVFFLVH